MPQNCITKKLKNVSDPEKKEKNNWKLVYKDIRKRVEKI